MWKLYKNRLIFVVLEEGTACTILDMQCYRWAHWLTVNSAVTDPLYSHTGSMKPLLSCSVTKKRLCTVMASLVKLFIGSCLTIFHRCVCHMMSKLVDVLYVLMIKTAHSIVEIVFVFLLLTLTESSLVRDHLRTPVELIHWPVCWTSVVRRRVSGWSASGSNSHSWTKPK